MELILTTKEELASEFQAALSSFIAIMGKDNHKVEKQFISVTEGFEHINNQGFKIAKATIYNLVHHKQIPYHKFGRQVVFDRLELDAWIRERITKKSRDYNAAVNIVTQSPRKKSNAYVK